MFVHLLSSEYGKGKGDTPGRDWPMGEQEDFVMIYAPAFALVSCY